MIFRFKDWNELLDDIIYLFWFWFGFGIVILCFGMLVIIFFSGFGEWCGILLWIREKFFILGGFKVWVVVGFSIGNSFCWFGEGFIENFLSWFGIFWLIGEYWFFFGVVGYWVRIFCDVGE